jgi:hypothetical protein
MKPLSHPLPRRPNPLPSNGGWRITTFRGVLSSSIIVRDQKAGKDATKKLSVCNAGAVHRAGRTPRSGWLVFKFVDRTLAYYHPPIN